jgi:hypothetical protein
MSIEGILKTNGGRSGGLLIYNVAKATALATNMMKHHLPVYPDTKARLERLFPQVDLDRVRIVKDANLPGHWWKDDTEAMTLGWTIYARASDLEYTYEGLRTLIHELVHVRQMRGLGEEEFACRYGEQLLEFGYENMPLEVEAYAYNWYLPFDLDDYLEFNPDVAASTGGDPAGTFTHWLDCGIAEGRRSARNFCVATYLAQNADLRDAGFDNFAAVNHWVESGHAEGRVSV